MMTDKRIFINLSTYLFRYYYRVDYDNHDLRCSRSLNYLDLDLVLLYLTKNVLIEYHRYELSDENEVDDSIEMNGDQQDDWNKPDVLIVAVAVEAGADFVVENAMELFEDDDASG